MNTVAKVMREAGVPAKTSKRFVPRTTDSGHQQPVAANARAVAPQRPGRSDRGVQYASDDYQRLLADHGLACSMSGKGDCWDNAVAKSFWGTLKAELADGANYATRDEARASIFEYVEVFYNRQRLHSSLGYLSPEQFEAGLN